MLFLVTLFAFFLSIISFYSWKRRRTPFFSLTALYCFIWGTIFFAHLTKAIPYVSLSPLAIIYALLPMIFMFLGEQVGSIELTEKYFVKAYEYNFERYKRILFYIIILGFVIASMFFIAVWKTWGLPWESEVMKNLKIERVLYGVQGAIGNSPLFFILRWITTLRCLPFAGILLGSYYFYRVERTFWVITIPILTCVMLDLSWGSRVVTYDALVLFAIVTILCLIQKNKKTIKKKQTNKFAFLVTIILVVIATIWGMQKITNKIGGEEKTDQIWGVSVPYSVWNLVDNHLAPLATFDVTIKDNKTTLGAMSLGGVAYWLYLFKIIPYQAEWQTWELEYPEIRDGSGINNANTYSWLRYLLSDFGMLGLCVVPFFLGFLATVLTKKASLNDHASISSFFGFVICIFLVVRSPAGMIFRNDYTMLTVLLIWFIPNLVIEKKTSTS
jgi:oligosaccharide repeat unit polymerase